MEIISRKDAKDLGLKVYFTGKTCVRGHMAERWVSTFGCVVCSKTNTINWRNKNREKSNELARKWYANNKYKAKLSCVRWQENNRERTREIGRAVYYRNKEIMLAKRRGYYVKNTSEVKNRIVQWNIKNPEKKRAYRLARRARVMGVDGRPDRAKDIARWVFDQEKTCYWCQINCEDSYHVDHYYPLRKGGEHKISNLVISCPTCNMRKGAKDPLEFAKQVGRLF